MAASSKTEHHKTARFRRAARELAAKVRRLREAKGWTVERAAERMSIEPAHVRRIEAATANPTLAVLISMAGAFGVHVAELLAEEGAGPGAGRVAGTPAT